MKHWWYRSGEREAKLSQLVVSGITESSSESEREDSNPRKEGVSPEERKLQRAIGKVLKEVEAEGPQINPRLLTQIGQVEPVDWNGWKGTRYIAALSPLFCSISKCFSE
jgi:hypothetical protein